MKPVVESKQSGDLKLVVYAGDNKILLAMSLPDDELDEEDKNLAGFAIWRTINGKTEVLNNRVSFTDGASKATTAATRKWTPSNEAPFQKFRWVDVPAEGFDAPITYRVQALYFQGQTQNLKAGDEVELTIHPAKVLHTKFKPAFTRGYIASQAYADKFHNAPIRPAGPKTPAFNTAPYQKQYEWLGADARKELFAFIEDCRKDTSCRVDVFAYDLDEPDVIKAICDLGTNRPGKVRAILDNADLHSKVDKKTGKRPPEIAAAKMVATALGEENVRLGHFARYQHNKVFIKRNADGSGERVIFGSMNFSVRGLYVQANNVIVVDDAQTAQHFADAFDVAYENDVAAAAFKKAPVAQGYLPGSSDNTPDLPKFSLALSPHKTADLSLGPMVDRIRKAETSVLFAVMEPTGKGGVLSTLRTIAAQPTIFSYGTVETDKGLAVQSPDGAMGDLTSFAALIKNVPAPFTAEFSGGSGKHIHDKFVVVDFNSAKPTVFTGSSNLASGGEEANGDSLVMIEDAAIANMFAIEAVALFDHYHFRKKMQDSPVSKPFTLWYPGKPGAAKPWWQPYYDHSRIQMRDRCLFAQVPLPADLKSKKDVDWSALDDAQESASTEAAAKKTGAAKTTKTAKSGKTSKTKKAPAKTSRTATSKSKSKSAKSKSAKSESSKSKSAKSNPSKSNPSKSKLSKSKSSKSKSSKSKSAKKRASTFKTTPARKAKTAVKKRSKTGSAKGRR